MVREIQRKRKQRKKFWMKDWYKKRGTHSFQFTLLRELADGGDYNHLQDHKRFMRIDEELFKEILQKIGPRIHKQTTNMRQPISPAERLSITLRYIATGSLGVEYGFRVSHSSLMKIIPETLQAIISEYGDRVRLPNTPDQWKAVADRFYERWQLPLCLGSIDGKHINIKKPANSGSLYFNYKKFCSIVLLGLVDADYRFMYLDIGAEGSCSDGGVFRESALNELLTSGQANFPPLTPLPGDTVPMPHYFVGDAAFALNHNMMTPYPKKHSGAPMTDEERIFNYRHSRARRTVECAFGILSSRLYCFFQLILI